MKRILVLLSGLLTGMLVLAQETKIEFFTPRIVHVVKSLNGKQPKSLVVTAAPQEGVFSHSGNTWKSSELTVKLDPATNNITFLSAKGKVLLGGDADQTHQRWRFQYAETVEDGGTSYIYYYIVAEHSGHVLMPDNTVSPADGTEVIQGKLEMYPEQQKWRVVDNGDGTYGLVTKLAQIVPELRLSLQDGAADAGTQLISAAADGSDAQKWRLNPVG